MAWTLSHLNSGSTAEGKTPRLGKVPLLGKVPKVSRVDDLSLNAFATGLADSLYRVSLDRSV